MVEEEEEGARPRIRSTAGKSEVGNRKSEVGTKEDEEEGTTAVVAWAVVGTAAREGTTTEACYPPTPNPKPNPNPNPNPNPTPKPNPSSNPKPNPNSIP
jgi:hypothetical protein